MFEFSFGFLLQYTFLLLYQLKRVIERKYYTTMRESRLDETLTREFNRDGRDVGMNDRVLEESTSYSVNTSSSFSSKKYFDLTETSETFDVFMSKENKGLGSFDSSEDSCQPRLPHEQIEGIALIQSTAISYIVNKKYGKFHQLLKKRPDVLKYRIDSNHVKAGYGGGGTILHVLVSQQPKIKKSPKGFSQRVTDMQVYPSVPENLLKSVIQSYPPALHMRDEKGRLPLHCACISMVNHINEMADIFKKGVKDGAKLKIQESNIVNTLLKYDKAATKICDDGGNLPLHYIANAQKDYLNSKFVDITISLKQAGPSAENTMKIILEAYPHGIMIENDVGMIALHNNVRHGKHINMPCFNLLMQKHHGLNRLPSVLNEDGESPLHLAVKKEVPIEAIEKFGVSDNGSKSVLFLQRNHENDNSLHLALRRKYPNKDLIKVIMKIAPFTAASPNSKGTMPIKEAVNTRLDSSIIIDMLMRDLPIEIGEPKQLVLSTSRSMSKFSKRKVNKKSKTVSPKIHGISHHHSWWYLLVVCRDYYLEVIYRFLSNNATHFQIVALARQIGPDGKSVLINSVSERCRLMFHTLLRFYDRYEILLSTNETRICNDEYEYGVQTFMALDHGPMQLEYSESLSIALDNIAQSGNAVKMKNEYDENEGLEVSIVPSGNYKVLLRTYAYEEEFNAELHVRKKFMLPDTIFEELLHHHQDEKYTHLSLSRFDKLFCIAFERPDHTLADVFFGMTSSTKTKKWIEKCRIVLKQIAIAIDNLHAQGLVHCHLEPIHICKYSNTWKLAKLGTVQEVGLPMNGLFRACVPPEAIQSSIENREECVEIESNKHFLFLRKSSKVKFTDGAINEGKERIPQISLSNSSTFSETELFANGCLGCEGKSVESSVGMKKPVIDENVALSFCPQDVKADTSWDMWGFGLIMAQILLGKCLYLPNFETPHDAIMKKLYKYDANTLQMICNQVYSKVGKDAADVIFYLLQKDPRKRATSMKQILEMPYFCSHPSANPEK